MHDDTLKAAFLMTRQSLHYQLSSLEVKTDAAFGLRESRLSYIWVYVILLEKQGESDLIIPVLV